MWFDCATRLQHDFLQSMLKTPSNIGHKKATEQQKQVDINKKVTEYWKQMDNNLAIKRPQSAKKHK